MKSIFAIALLISLQFTASSIQPLYMAKDSTSIITDTSHTEINLLEKIKAKTNNHNRINENNILGIIFYFLALFNIFAGIDLQNQPEKFISFNKLVGKIWIAIGLLCGGIGVLFTTNAQRLRKKIDKK